VFDPDSRYANLPVARWTRPDGLSIVYVTRRLLPPVPEGVLGEVTLGAGDRLDLEAARTLGDPLKWWQIADANPALDPDELDCQPGRRVRIAAPRL
jgi:hypothetical protein